ncbi:unnamed protein product, partial [Didymodactylos carnosus]
MEASSRTHILLGIIAFLTLVIFALVAAALGVIVKVANKQDDAIAVRTTTTTSAGTATTTSSSSANNLVTSITVDQMMSHLNAFQEIADNNGRTRAIHTRGFELTLDYITKYLTDNTDLKVHRQDFNWSTFNLTDIPTFSSNITGVNKIYTRGVGADFY